MLRGKAQTYYYQHLAGKGLTFCLEITIERLQRTYLGLTQNYGTTNELNLAGQLVSACQGVPACSQVLVRPATTFEAVALELRSAIGIWTRCNPTQQYVNHTPLSPDSGDAYYTDRRYNRNARYDRDEDSRNPYPRRNRFNNDRQDRYPGGNYNGRNRSNQASRVKKCFVCGKVDCWSTRHSAEERVQSRRRFQTYAQDHADIDPDYHVFLALYEGIDEGNSDSLGEDDDELDTFYNAANFVTTALNNAATTYAITGIDPYKDEGAQEATHLFTFHARYGAEIF
ncbi:hypothetical protein BDW02DRAFT_603927 [Decorospora gaudefroyi]|uniref:Uncharacterized protein n=1 Tax=Decorospora gaudefroyi TaxID=184978 RepID=A0A6A5K3N1_9PLEO|nr:hypothetical protein BDW02DRAFT_603927 [Decorospora gaudefroyi]